MKMLIQIVLVALIVGGMSAGGSFYWHQKFAKSATTAPEAETSPPEKSDESKIEDTSDELDTSEAESHLEHSETTISDQVAQADPEPKLDQPEPTREPLGFGPPAGVRPPFETNGDEAGELINRLRAKALSTSRQERRMAEREEAMKIIVDDLRDEQAAAAKMRKRVLDETNRMAREVAEARRSTDAERAAIYRATQAERAKMDADQQEERRLAEEQIERLTREKDEAVLSAENALKAARNEQEEMHRDKSGSPEETTNLKDTIRRIDSIPAENTAEILQELVKKGRTEAVVAILNGMKPRQCASVLSLISEKTPALAADLIDGMKRLKKETQSAAGTAK